ncbi:methionine synthase reductase isoform 1-T2 [Synchiropus picturatus]
MPFEVKPRFVVLYGSQKGQAQSIAEGIAEEAETHGLVADLSCLSDKDKYDLDREKSPVVFVVSTTGDGEPPDNALKFVKSIKKKSLSTKHFKDLTYALLALGDTNYANFCNCGKTIERRLQELGAKQFYETGYADDGVGLEVVVDPWLEGLWQAIKEAVSNTVLDENSLLKMDAAKETPDISLPDLHLNLLSINGHETCSSSDAKSPSAESTSGSAINTAVSDVKPVSCDTASIFAEELKTKTVEIASSLTSSVPPLSESPLNVPALPPAYLEVSLQGVNTVNEVMGPLLRDKPSEVPVSRAVQLTRGDSVKTALLLELDITDHPNLAYQPGDSFDVFCPNNPSEVAALLQRLGLESQRNHQVQVNLRNDTKKKGAQLPVHIPQNISLNFLFTWCLDFRSVPKKAFLRTLVEYTADGVEKRRIQELCSKQGAMDYNLYVRESSLSVLELLTAFPSCSPPLSVLVEHLPKLQPRPYSAASSSERHQGKLHFVFNVVEFPAQLWRPKGRRGLCTGWLSDLINSILIFRGSGDTISSPVQEKPQIHVSLRPNCSFRAPTDPSVPFIMVGPGTGVAPFIGFLQQREFLRLQNPDTDFGETWLFFGCRHRDRDYLFRDELEGFVSNKTLNHLKVCFSRETEEDRDTAAHPKYVQHNMLHHSQQIMNILFDQSGFLYVCGDAKNMAKDVNDSLLEMIQTHLKVDQLEAMKRVAGLREERRYLQDIWA